MLSLWRKPQISVLFCASHDKGPNDSVEFFCQTALNFKFLIFVSVMVLDSFFNLVKKFSVMKQVRHDKVEETPEFSKVVAQGGSC